MIRRLIGRFKCRLGRHAWHERLFHNRGGYYEVCERPDCAAWKIFMEFE